MHIRIIHFYPDLMNLYGSYANVSVLQRVLERAGAEVTVETVAPGQDCDLSGADFLFMGAGTERRQKTAAQDFLRFADAVKAAAEAGTPMLFCGTAMELLGKSITDADGQEFAGIGLAAFTSVQGKRRMVEDVYGTTDLYTEPVVGFINKCSIIKGIETPLLTATILGYGNEGPVTAEGFRHGNVFASHLTGPILVKNPMLLEAVADAIFRHKNAPIPQKWDIDSWLTDGYAITAEQLKRRTQA